MYNLTYIQQCKSSSKLLLEKQLSYDDGFLTQTQKVKRNKVHSYFKDKIEKLYS